MNRVCVVTGGTRGIGKAVSNLFHQQGYRVIANYNKNHESAEAFSKQYNIPVLSFDVSHYESCEKAFQRIQKNYGDIDIIIHSAGITKDGFFHKASPDDWNKVIQTNLVSCFNVTRPIISKMREKAFGRIIFISSINGLKGQIGQTNYCASKAGIIGFTKALALENARKGITVNGIAPGYIATDMLQGVPEKVLETIINEIPVRRLGLPSEIAQSALFLAHDQSGFITGETLNINGGHYMA